MRRGAIVPVPSQSPNPFQPFAAYVLLGVEEEGHPDCASWDSWVDHKIYFYLSADEMANLKVGDVLNDGEDFTILEIDQEPTIYEVEYSLEEVA
jgi:hypothetical protein